MAASEAEVVRLTGVGRRPNSEDFDGRELVAPLRPRNQANKKVSPSQFQPSGKEEKGW